MSDPSYDLIVIGGGATGTGIALDGALRGLRILLLEQNDYGEGTSSRSTKLVHGGVRYLEAAVKHLDREQYALVREGLRERKIFLQNASHLARPVELITPIYRWWELPYVYAGLVLYDLLAGKASLGRSRLLTPRKARRLNPNIDPRGLKGAVSYYDGAFLDSRMVIALVQSAREAGADLYNHRRVESLLQESGRVVGVRARDRLSGALYEYRARIVLNATGPFADRIRQMEDPSAEPIMEPSSGIHLVLPGRFLPSPDGVLIPETDDGRVLFALPWQGRCLVGTTDEPAKLREHPAVSREEIDYLLGHLNRTFAMKATPEDILSAFSGLRPLVREPGESSTASLVREYLTELNPGGMLTVAGGKWTSYRAMAQKAVDRVCQLLEHPASCSTHHHPVVGSRTPRKSVEEQLRQAGLDPDTLSHLLSHYGDQSPRILKLARAEHARSRLHPDDPVTEAELIYTLRHEEVRKPLDFLVRRSTMALRDRTLALAALPRTLEIMAKELDWDPETKEHRAREAEQLLKEGF